MGLWWLALVPFFLDTVSIQKSWGFGVAGMVYRGLSLLTISFYRHKKLMSLPPCSSIHNLGLVGHIEDIAVAKDQQGKKLGLRIIQALDYVAEKVGCYKVR